MIRTVENNDWVTYTILGVSFLYVIISNFINKDISILEYLGTSIEDDNHAFLNNALISTAYLVSLCLLFSQFIPIVPATLSKDWILPNYHLNKMGVSLLCLSSLFLFRHLLGYLFFISTGSKNKWNKQQFALTNFYLVWTLATFALVIFHYYICTDKLSALDFYAKYLIFIMICKVLFLIFHRNNILPKEWYYKILYICTFQILPTMVLWKYLFI